MCVASTHFECRLQIIFGPTPAVRQNKPGQTNSGESRAAAISSNEHARFLDLHHSVCLGRRVGVRAGFFVGACNLEDRAMKAGYLFRSEGVWRTWATCLTLAGTGNYELAKRWYGGFSMLRRLGRSNPHRFGDHISRTDGFRLVDEWISREERRNGTGHSQDGARLLPWLWRSALRLAAMCAGVLLDLVTLATSRGLIEVSKGLFQHRGTILRGCLPSGQCIKAGTKAQAREARP